MGRKSAEVLAGIDVGSRRLNVCVRLPSGEKRDLEFDNTVEGHGKLVRYLNKAAKTARVVCEATSTYGLDLCLRLTDARVRVMVVNPKSARRFMEAQMRRAKTDKVDARALLEFLERMSFEEWSRPSPPRLMLRLLARRIADLTKIQTAEKNRLHAMTAMSAAPASLVADLESSIAGCAARIDRLVEEAVQLMQSYDDLRGAYEVAISMKGVKEKSAVALLGELLLLPPDMQPREIVAHAGLDPRPKESGDSRGKRKISKVGNAVLRGALYMPTLTASQHEPTVRRHYEHLLAGGREDRKLVALTAVSRKLLVCLWRMLQTNTRWDPARFSPRFASDGERAPA